MIKKNFSLKDWLNLALVILEFCMNFLFIPCQADSWNILLDLRNVSIYSLPDYIKEIFNTFHKNYRYRLNKIYIFNINYITNLLWKVIRMLLVGKNIYKNFRIVNSEKDFSELFQNISKNQIKKKFGGYSEKVLFGFEFEN